LFRPIDSGHTFKEYQFMAAGSFFQRLKQGLSKSRENLLQNIGTIFQNRHWDEQSLETMEESLIAADVGVKATEKLMQVLRQQSPSGDGESAEMSSRLQSAMIEMLAQRSSPATIAPFSVKPWVVIFLGVNGIGKTKAMGKMCSWSQPIRFAPLPSSNSIFGLSGSAWKSSNTARARIPRRSFSTVCRPPKDALSMLC